MRTCWLNHYYTNSPNSSNVHSNNFTHRIKSSVVADPQFTFSFLLLIGYASATGVPYANADLCPDIINKRLCAFLPLTNCTMPGYLTEVSGPEVLTGKYWPVDIVVYTNASVSGSLVPGACVRVSVYLYVCIRISVCVCSICLREIWRR